MNDRMNGLIELTNLNHQKSFKHHCLQELLMESTSSFKDEMSEIGGSFQFNIEHKLPSLELSRELILQLFENIFNNSIKFRKKQEPLCIKIELTRDTYENIKINIIDNGIGFNAQFKSHIFKPFQRLHSDHEYEGQGMGLAICFQIMQRQKGSIMAESQEGKGTKITLTFSKPQSI